VSKYRNVKTKIGDLTFDSKREAERYLVLRDRQRKGEICGLRTQVVFRLEVNGLLVCKYIADFEYIENGTVIVEDVKSEITKKIPIYRLKKKLLFAIHGIRISEV
jgi:hypothetical protein